MTSVPGLVKLKRAPRSLPGRNYSIVGKKNEKTGTTIVEGVEKRYERRGDKYIPRVLVTVLDGVYALLPVH